MDQPVETPYEYNTLMMFVIQYVYNLKQGVINSKALESFEVTKLAFSKREVILASYEC